MAHSTSTTDSSIVHRGHGSAVDSGRLHRFCLIRIYSRFVPIRFHRGLKCWLMSEELRLLCAAPRGGGGGGHHSLTPHH